MKALLFLLLLGACLTGSKAFFWGDLETYKNTVTTDEDQSHHHHHHHKHDSHHTATTLPQPPAPHSNDTHTTTERYVYNATTASSHLCPMLYTRVGDRCLAFFTVARVPWTAAQQFCHGIFGDLITFSNIHQYTELLQYLQNSEIGVDLWVGGHEDKEDRFKWVWVDQTPMPTGTPYWAIKSTLTSPKGDYYHRGATITYMQAPLTTTYRDDPEERCAAMTPKYYFYLTDELCGDWKSPLCVLREGVEVVMVRGSEHTYPGIFIPTDDTQTTSVLVEDDGHHKVSTEAPEGSNEEEGGSNEEEGGSNEEEEGSNKEEEGSNKEEEGSNKEEGGSNKEEEGSGEEKGSGEEDANNTPESDDEDSSEEAGDGEEGSGAKYNSKSDYIFSFNNIFIDQAD
ncbi:uncharacterized protein LOC121870239 [Homarus americanus]